MMRARSRIVALAGLIGGLMSAGMIAGVAPAAAQSVWWHISTMSMPTNLPPGGEGEIRILATNVGDATLHSTGSPVRITDKLPPGLKATAMSGRWGTVGLRGEESECPAQTCEFEGTLLPFEPLEVTIRVKLDSGAHSGEENEAIISGGGLPTDTARRPITVSSAPVPYGAESYEFSPEEEGGLTDSHAGTHPFQLTTTLLLNQTADVLKPPAMTKDLHFQLPPGLVGNPTPFPQCSGVQFTVIVTFGEDACPPDTAIGVADVRIDLFGEVITLPVPVFNLVPNVGEPARFGFYVLDVPVSLDTSVRTGRDYGVTVSVDNISQSAMFLGSQVTLWGVPGDARHDSSRGSICVDGELLGGGACNSPGLGVTEPFLTLPTSCTGPLQTSVQTDSWKEAGVFGAPVAPSAAPSLDSCNKLTFNPEITVAPDVSSADSPTGLTVKIHVPQDESLVPGGRSESNVRSTVVTLPAGVAINAAGADGLAACSEAQIGFEGLDPTGEFELFSPVLPTPFCPDAAKIGTVRIKTPLLPNELTGAAYLAAPAPSGESGQNPFNSLIAMYIVAEDPVSGTLVKIPGQVSLDASTGQLVSTFKDTPQVPFEDFTISFFGGARAPLATPSQCGSYTTTTSISPWSGNPPSQPASAFAIISGPSLARCLSPLPFAPSLTAQTTSIQAGGFSPFAMTMSREDGNQNLDAITLHMPAGLSGVLSGVTLCGEAQADAGTCGAGSQIGETVVSVGAGGDPFTVSGGKVFLTGPYHGAPYGLSIVTPAKAGPFDLGQVVVRAKIEVDPTTAALTVTTDTSGPYRIPTIVDGIPLQIRHVTVAVNRAGFTFNPTNCAKMAVTGSLTSSEGAVDELSVPFQVTNCAVLGFKPKFSVATSAHHTRTNGVSLDVKLTYPSAPFGSQSNIARVRVELPKQLPSRLTTLQKACPDTVFNTNPDGCPAASRVGEAIATTPIIPEHFSGPAYFVSHGGVKFPELIIALHGYALTVDLHGETFISKAGVTSTTFNTVPDVPIGSFELKLPAGPGSALAANGDLCASKLVMPTTFTAQNGAVMDEKTPIAVQGCAPEIRVIRHRVRGKRATLVVSVPSAGTLVAGGYGIQRVRTTVQGAGTVTVVLRLSKADQRFVAHHHGRRLMAPIGLSFTPSRGKRLEASVAVLMR